MILGIDHVALSCRNIQAAAETLGREGMKLQFMARDIPNAAAKRPLLREYRPIHSLAYCRPATGIAIELTDHGTEIATPEPSPYQVVFNRAPQDLAGDHGPSPISAGHLHDAKLFGDHELAIAAAAVWTPFATAIHHLQRHQEPLAVAALLLPVRDVEAAATFWSKAFGFRAETTPLASPHRHLSFRGPVPNWNLSLILTPTEKLRTSHLDDRGFPCLALLAKNLDEALAAAIAAGAHDATSGFTVEVGGKQLRVAMFRGPDEALIELIEFQR